MYFSRNNKYTLFLSLLAFVFLFTSCVGEENETSAPKPIDNSKAQILLQMPTSTYGLTDADDPESQISNLSLFIFDSATGTKEHYIRLNIPYTGSSTDVDMSRWASDQVIMLLNADILSNLNKTRNIHIVANIAENKISTVANETALKAVITDAITAEIPAPTAAKPITMHGVKNNHNFTTDIRASITLIRNVAKISMSMNTQTFTFGGKNITLAPLGQNITTKMGALSDRSHLIPTTTSPATTTYFTCGNKTIVPTQEALAKTKSSATYYINENLRTSYDIEANATYAIIQIPYNVEGDASIKTANYYKVLINSDNGYKINRNTIYNITLNISSLGGESDASALLVEGTLNILPWNQNTIVSDISQTFLTVKETTTKVAITSNFYYSTNATAADCSLQTGATWLTATFDVANNIKLTAVGTTYTVPRTTTLSIKTKNLTKTVNVTQEPKPITGTGSITLNPKTIYISETPNYKDVALTITPTTATSLRIDGNLSIASCNHTTGAGNKTVRFTRGGTYGNSYFKFANLQTMEYDSVQVCNLYLKATTEDIGVPGEGGTFTEGDIQVLGGDAKWVVKSKPTWVTSASNVGGELMFSAGAEPNEQDRSGYIVINHINDVNYTKSIKIVQSAKFIRFPDFDYLVIRYLWGSKPVGHPASLSWDVDTATELRNTGVVGLDRLPVGWSIGVGKNTARTYKGYDFIEWGGDNTQNGYECAFVNMYNLCNTSYPIYDELPRYFNVDLYATWYTKTIRPRAIEVEITLYKGGTMSGVNTYDYENSGGIANQVYKESIPNVMIRTEQGVGSFRTAYTNIGTVRYDKMKNTATFTLNATRQSIPEPFIYPAVISTDLLPGESKEDCELRLEQYRINNGIIINNQ